MTTLIAAHPDDDLIGAWSRLAARQIQQIVYAVPDAFSPARWPEALACAQAFGANVLDCRGAAQQDPTYRLTVARVLVPSPSDPHPEHQAALTWALRHVTATTWEEYTIEKMTPYRYTLDGQSVSDKTIAFQRYYPSQISELTDPKFFLFEGFAPLGVPSITVSGQAAGLHHWPDAPEAASFLRQPHRHLFHWRLTLHELYQADRQYEFFDVQAWGEWDFAEILRASASCEVYARQFACHARARFGVPCSAWVSEDGENAAEVRI